MAVDEQGLICVCPQVPFQPEFSTALQQSVQQLVRQLGSLLHSLYVYGSVAAGRAQAYQSDLDLSLIFTRPAAAAEQGLINNLRSQLEMKHSMPPEYLSVTHSNGRQWIIFCIRRPRPMLPRQPLSPRCRPSVTGWLPGFAN